MSGDKILKAIAKSFCWNFIGVLFGLMQLGILFLLTSLNGTFFDIDKIFKDGVILFFCSAFVAASGAEYYFTKRRYAKLFEAFFFYISPILLIVSIVVLYCGVIGFGEVNMNVLKKGTYTCFTLSIMYSLIFHTLKFHSWRSK